MPSTIRPIRVLAILEALAKSPSPLSLSQLSSSTHIPRSSLIRLLEQLMDTHYVAKLPSQESYITGPNTISLGFSLINTSPFLVQAQNILTALVNQIGETCNLTYLNKNQVQYLVRVEHQKVLRLQLHLPVGTKVPLHCTASGKVLLAHLNSYDQAQMLSSLSLAKYTEKTIEDAKTLNRELERTKSQQIGIDNEEFVKGMIALAVPIFDQKTGACIAALACHAPVAHTRLADLHLHIPSLQKASTQIAKLLIKN